ncbi:MAG: hypothetical protein RMJ87_04890 [Cytophagales bacterium]|nr:hypothetical protein [Bernardetiaceae bacterium]MDW8204348.1 hypothetical protein [Cytophagales bacterium]
MHLFFALKEPNYCYRKILLALAKQASLWLFLLSFIAQTHPLFFADLFYKDKIEQTSDDSSIENESDNSSVADSLWLKKNKCAKKKLPLGLPPDICIPVINTNNFLWYNCFFAAIASCTNDFIFIKTPRYIAFQSLIFYEE